MAFLVQDGPMALIYEALATHPVVRAWQIVNNLQPVAIQAAPAAAAPPPEQPEQAPPKPKQHRK
jgi:hypothetical protein